MEHSRCWCRLRRKGVSYVRQCPDGQGAGQVPEGPTHFPALPSSSSSSLSEEGKEQGVKISPGSRSGSWVLILTPSLIKQLCGTIPLSTSVFSFLKEMVWHSYLWQFYVSCQLYNSITYFMNAMLKYYSFNSLVCGLFMGVWGLFLLDMRYM